MTLQKTLVAALIAAGVCALVATTASADPIVPNGSFALGNTGFTTGYNFVTYPALQNDDAMKPQGAYTIGGDPRHVHDYWPRFGDHTGDGKMMIVNGSEEMNIVVWSAVLSVVANTQYDFSAWAASTYWRSPATLAFSINDQQLGSPMQLTSTTGLWQFFTAGWNSGSQTTATLRIVDLNTEWFGNDFALDDIALGTVEGIDERDIVQPVPEPASMMLFGSGLVGLASALKRRRRGAKIED